MDAGGQIRLELRDLGGDFVGDGDGVGGGLAGDVEQDGGAAVGGDDGVDGLGGRDDVGHVGDANGTPAGVVLTTSAASWAVRAPARRPARG